MVELAPVMFMGEALWLVTPEPRAPTLARAVAGHRFEGRVLPRGWPGRWCRAGFGGWFRQAGGPGQLGLRGPGQFGLDLRQAAPLRLVPLDRHQLEQMAVAVARLATSRERPVKQPDGRVPPDHPSVRNHSYPAVRRPYVAGAQRTRDALDQLRQGPLLSHQLTVTLSYQHCQARPLHR